MWQSEYARDTGIGTYKSRPILPRLSESEYARDTGIGTPKAAFTAASNSSEYARDTGIGTVLLSSNHECE